jgi:hypothetical protein
MNTKKSLGHFPFGSNAFEKSELSFIPDINGDHPSDKAKDEKSAFDVTPSDIEKRKLASKRIDDELVASEIVERDIPEAEEAEPVKKKIASYYIDEVLINRLKAYSDAVNSSYSAVTADAIECFISERGF